MRRTIASLLFFLSFTTAQAQSNGYSFTNYTVANGLADNSVNCILQDSRGFIWIGTREGLSRFDGTNFKNFFSRKDDPTSLPGNIISTLTEYQPGQLLVSVNGKLTRFNTLTKQFQQLPAFAGKIAYEVNPYGDQGYFVRCDDTCFIINHQLQVTGNIIPPLKTKGRSVNGYYLNDSTWLIGSQKEYFIYHVKNKTFTPLPLTVALPPEQQFFPFHCYDAKKQQLYFSNFWDGIYVYSVNGQLLQHYRIGNDAFSVSEGNISFIKIKNDSTAWVGTLGSGLHILHLFTKQFTKVTASSQTGSLTNDIVTSACTDKDQNEWLGTVGGIAKQNAATAVINSWQTTPEGEAMFNLLNIKKGADGNIYAGSLGSRIVYRIAPGGNSLQELDKAKLPGIWCLNNLGNDLVFTGNSSAFTRYNPATASYTRSNFLAPYFPTADLVILAFKHSNGDEWFSGNNGGGFVRVSAKDNKVHVYKKDGPRGKFTISYYGSYAEDKNGDVWFGVNKTELLLHWNMRADSFTEVALGRLKGMNGDNLNGITDVICDNNNNLWIASDGSGIVKYNISAGTAEKFTRQDGLSTDYAFALQFDNKNRLWIGTSKGLSCFLTQEKKFINFSKADGLPDDHFIERCLFFDSATSKLWAGSTNALMNFEPDVLLNMNKKKLPVYIDAIIVNGKNFTAVNMDHIIFPASDNNLQFYFIGLDINNGKDIEYSYKLSGADKDWIYNADISNASYANLPHGKYTFTVRAKHKGDNEWTEMTVPLAFTIQPHWWQTWWFRAGLGIVVALLLFALIKAYLRRQLQKQKNTMEKELAIEQERTRMARELHDGLGSMLSGIKHSFSALKNNIALDDQQQTVFHSNIDKLNESIKELRNISHSIASESLMNYGLENSLRDYCNSMATPGVLNINFSALDTDHMQLTEEQSFHVFRIVQELINNVLKHSGAANAIVQISCNSNRLYIAVEDDGKGFIVNESSTARGMGLRNIESRIKILKGKMDYRSTASEGTSFLMEIPCSQKS